MKKSISVILAILMCFSCFSIISFAETTDSEHITTVPQGYIGIYTLEDLDNVRDNLEGKYILMNDLEFTEEDYAEGGSFYGNGYGWLPISNFSGTFDGNNYSIINLRINGTKNTTGTQYHGLFGYVSYATIKNLYLLNVNIETTKQQGDSHAGGICGKAAYSSISTCIVSGTINALVGVTGGICGYILGDQTYGKSTIENCVNLANISSTDRGGGIVGQISDDSTIEKCINIGNISAINKTGGIVGFFNNSYRTNIINCFNTGHIEGSYSGGIIGYTVLFENRNSNIKNCYSISTTPSGGITSYTNIDYPVFTTCYHLVNDETNFNYKNGIEKTSKELSQQETFENWDFDTVWTMDGRPDYPYPELKDVPLIFLGETIPHEHKYTSIIEQEATHLEEGIETFTCFCGDSYTETIAKIEAHDYKADITEPTCTEQGYTTYTCECGDSYVADYVAANGHDYTSVITKEATHLEEGIKTFTCFCGDSYTETIEKIETHDYKADITEPTCTEQGYTTYTCECGDSYVADYVAANGHDYTSVITKEATHLEEGIKTFTCFCGDSYTEAIAKIEAHDYEATVTEPTCTEQGYTTYTCECGDSYVADYVDANGHDYTSEITTPATHLNDGVETFTCPCGDSYTEVIAKTEEHTYSSQVIKQATCSAKGTILYTCICGDEYTETIPAINHIDENSDFICDMCNSEFNYCSHLCHRDNIFAKIVWKIIIFICSIFGTSATCACGRPHY